jgi:hypothetical protein
MAKAIKVSTRAVTAALCKAGLTRCESASRTSGFQVWLAGTNIRVAHEVVYAVMRPAAVEAAMLKAGFAAVATALTAAGYTYSIEGTTLVIAVPATTV